MSGASPPPLGGRGFGGGVPLSIVDIPDDETPNETGIWLPQWEFGIAYFHQGTAPVSGTIDGAYGLSISIDESLDLDSREDRWEPEDPLVVPPGALSGLVPTSSTAEHTETESVAWDNLATGVDGSGQPALFADFFYTAIARVEFLKRTQVYRRTVEGETELLLPINVEVSLEWERPLIAEESGGSLVEIVNEPALDSLFLSPFDDESHTESDLEVELTVGDLTVTQSLFYTDTGSIEAPGTATVFDPNPGPPYNDAILYYTEASRTGLAADISGLIELSLELAE